MIFTVLLVSVIIGFLTTLLVRSIARRHKVGAMSDGRMVHKGFVPIMGGLGIFFGFIAGIIVAVLIDQRQAVEFLNEYWGILAGSFLMIMTGVYDDLRGLNAPQKFLLQFIAVSVVIASGCYIQNLILPSIGVTIDLGWFAIPLTYLWIIGMINAINLLDGLDGLAAGISFIVVIVFAVAGFETGNGAIVILSIALAGGILGFMKFNYHPASIFMGDTGSLFLGMILAVLSIKAFEGEPGTVALLSPVIALAIPIGDTSIAFFRRLNQGNHPFQPDKDHLHHRLMYLGLTHKQTVYIIYLVALLYALTAIVIRYQTPLFAVLVLSLILIISILGLNRIGFLEAERFRKVIGGRRASFIKRQTAPLAIRRVLHKLLLIICDVIMINLAWYLTWMIRFYFKFIPADHPLSFAEIAITPVALLMSLIWLILFVLNDLYRMHWDVSRFDQVIIMSKTIIFGAIIIFLVTIDFDNPVSEGRIAVAIYAALLMILANAGRLSLIYIEKKFKILEYKPHPTLLVGTTDKARKLLREIAGNPHFLYQPIGYVAKSAVDKPFYDLPPLGTYEDISELIRRYNITEVIIAISDRSRDEILNIVSIVENPTIAVKIIPQMYELVSGHKTQEMIGHPLIRVFSTHLRLWQWAVKRTIDIVASLGMIFLSIPFAIVIFTLQLFSWIYPPLRIINVVGKNQKVFGLVNLTIKNSDGKRNWLGAILIKTRFYKFPSLINILLGKMSFVGPRPETTDDVKILSEKIKFYQRRFQIRPGLTGWAQVKYRYDDSVKTKRDQYKQDLFYLENMSLMFDLRIVLRSLKIFFFGRKL